MDGVQRSVTTVSGYLDPLRDFVSRTPDCAANPVCSTVELVLQPVDSLVQTSTRLGDDAAKLTRGSSAAATAISGLPQTVTSMKDALGQARSAARDLLGLSETIGPQLHQLTTT